MLKRAANTYILMSLFCAAGLWVILAYGGTQVAPPDLAGKWKLAEPAALGPTMNVEQSGRFFQISFDNGSVLKLKLVNQQGTRLKLSGHGWTLFADLSPGGEDMGVHLTGEQSIDGSAHRVLRTYPTDPANPAGGH
jgi:hypothetical protein